MPINFGTDQEISNIHFGLDSEICVAYSGRDNVPMFEQAAEPLEYESVALTRANSAAIASNVIEWGNVPNQTPIPHSMLENPGVGVEYRLISNLRIIVGSNQLITIDLTLFLSNFPRAGFNSNVEQGEWVFKYGSTEVPFAGPNNINASRQDRGAGDPNRYNWILNSTQSAAVRAIVAGFNNNTITSMTILVKGAAASNPSITNFQATYGSVSAKELNINNPHLPGNLTISATISSASSWVLKRTKDGITYENVATSSSGGNLSHEEEFTRTNHPGSEIWNYNLMVSNGEDCGDRFGNVSVTTSGTPTFDPVFTARFFSGIDNSARGNIYSTFVLFTDTPTYVIRGLEIRFRPSGNNWGSWQAVTPSNSYTEFDTITFNSAVIYSRFLSGISSLITYEFQFRAFNNVGRTEGETNLSDVLSMQFHNVHPPPAGFRAIPATPSGFSVARSGNNVNLSWNAVPDVDGYIYFWNTSVSSNYTLVDVGNVTSATFEIPSGNVSGTIYNFRMYAYRNGYGASINTAIASVTT